jgi:hypothetical protein
MTPYRPSERIRRSVIVPIQMGGSFLISLTSPLITLANKVLPRKSREVTQVTERRPEEQSDSFEIKVPRKPDQPGQSR